MFLSPIPKSTCAILMWQLHKLWITIHHSAGIILANECLTKNSNLNREWCSVVMDGQESRSDKCQTNQLCSSANAVSFFLLGHLFSDFYMLSIFFGKNSAWTLFVCLSDNFPQALIQINQSDRPEIPEILLRITVRFWEGITPLWLTGLRKKKINYFKMSFLRIW